MEHAEFLSKLRSHDPVAARYLAESYVPTLWRNVFHQLGGQSHLAEDVVSETVLALIHAVERGDEIAHPLAWMRTVAKRRIQDHFRAAARIRGLLASMAEESPTADTRKPDAGPMAAEVGQSVLEALNRLHENERLALEWKYVDRIRVRQIAGRLSMTEKATEALLFRARNKLRSLLRHLDPAVVETSGQPASMPPANDPFTDCCRRVGFVKP